MNTIYEKDLVSVIIPTYKRSEMLLRALDSILNQTYKNIEVLLVNDNEPDDEFSVEVRKKVEKYQSDARFNFIMQKKHVNGAVARNVGIKKAKGEYIAFLDDDDWWEANKIEEQVKEIKKLDDSWGGVSCKFTLYDEIHNVIGRTKKYRDGYIYKDILNLMTDAPTGTLLLRHDCLDKTRCFDEALLRHQDLQLLVDFTSHYKLKEVDLYLHCVDVSDTQNRPDPKKLIKFKEAFFKSINPVMNLLSDNERKCIYAMHKYELSYVCLKNREWVQGLSYCKSVLCTPRAYYLVLKKTFIKIIQIFKR